MMVSHTFWTFSSILDVDGGVVHLQVTLLHLWSGQTTRKCLPVMKLSSHKLPETVFVAVFFYRKQSLMLTRCCWKFAIPKPPRLKKKESFCPLRWFLMNATLPTEQRECLENVPSGRGQHCQPTRLQKIIIALFGVPPRTLRQKLSKYRFIIIELGI